MEKNANKVAVYALGGLGEVGKNCYVIEDQNTMICIDAGVMFADSGLPGVNYIIPDFTRLKEAGNKFKALFITHGHEDHIGGIPFLLQRVNVPVIYAPRLAIALIKHKIAEMKTKVNTKLVEYDDRSVINAGSFKVAFVHVTHSIPDSYGIKVETPEGTIMTTGDFKVDLTPVDHDFDLDRLAKFGSEGVDLLLADSTNAEKEGYTQSEKSVIHAINEIFRNTEGRLIVSTFSSNISRIQQIIEAAKHYERKIAIFGRSMESNIQAAREFGYIDLPDSYIIKNPDELRKTTPSQILILCTGSQGEPLAALSRIAYNTHRQVKIAPGDTIVLSSSPIPGNTAAINKVINQLTRDGANVLVNSIFNQLHASGHPCRQELRLIQKIVRPKYFMPVHGEYHMLKLHADVAVECGLARERTFVCSNGDVVYLQNHHCFAGERIKTDVEYLESTESIGISTNCIKERRWLSTNGVVSIAFATDNHKLIGKPNITTKGFSYYVTSESSYVKDLANKLAEIISNSKAKYESDLKEEINSFTSQYFYKVTRRNPLVITSIAHL